MLMTSGIFAEVLHTPLDQAFTIDNTGQLTKPESVDWPAPPEESGESWCFRARCIADCTLSSFH